VLAVSGGKENKPSRMILFSLYPINMCFTAELQRAKRASEEPWVRKIGNPSSQENVVMTSAYERPYVRPDSGGGGGASRDIPHGHPYGKLRIFV